MLDRDMSKASYLKIQAKAPANVKYRDCQAAAMLDQATREQSVYNWRSLITEPDSYSIAVIF